MEKTGKIIQDPQNTISGNRAESMDAINAAQNQWRRSMGIEIQ